MRILMLGWEFPPFISGGLGTACYGLTKALSDLGAEVLFVLPRGAADQQMDRVRIVSVAEKHTGRTHSIWKVDGLEHVRLIPVGSALSPYQTEEQYREGRKRQEAQRDPAVREKAGDAAAPAAADPGKPTSLGIMGSPGHYSGDMFAEIHRYARIVAEVARQNDFDVIHAHDWMTFPAGLSVAALSGKPLVVHVHSTEFDRSGTNINQRIYDIERAGTHGAWRVICVSRMTRDILTPATACRKRSAVSSTTPSRSTANRSTTRSTASRRTTRSSCSSAASRSRKGRSTSWRRPRRCSRSWTT